MRCVSTRLMLAGMMAALATGPALAADYAYNRSIAFLDDEPAGQAEAVPGAVPYQPAFARPAWSAVAGVEATFLKPFTADHDLFVEYELGDDSGSTSAREFSGFDDLKAAPRIWLGLENDNGWGLRTRYWRLEGNAAGDLWDAAITPFPADASLQLKAETLDLELTRRFPIRSSTMLGTFGVRHASLESRNTMTSFYREWLWDPSSTPREFGTEARSSRRTDATGLTMALEGRRPIGDGGLALASNVRGSVLWGSGQAMMGTALFAWEGGNEADSYFSDSYFDGVRENVTQYIFEIQAGMEWKRRVRPIRSDLFAHLMFEYQRWTADESRLDLTLPLSPYEGYGLATGGRGLSSNVDFTGLSFAVGLTR